jgi:tRNA-specific 2-thiouridylase
MNWQGPTPTGPTCCVAQIRARHRGAAATAVPLSESRARVRFDTPELAVTPGQAVTLYQDDMVLGGGWIDRAIDD